MHLTSPKYNFMVYNGKIRFRPPAGKEIFLIQKIGYRLDEKDVIYFFLYNIMQTYIDTGNFNTFVGNYAYKENFAIFNKWTSWWSAAEYNFKNDLQKLSKHSFRELIDLKDGHPPLFKMFSRNEVHPNTVAIIFILFPQIVKYLDDNKEDPVLGQFILYLKKYSMFIEIDRKKYREIFDSYFTNRV